MADFELTQSDADFLIALEKHRGDEEERTFPQAGIGLEIPLLSFDQRESFALNIYRGKMELSKITFQNRGRRVIPLVRLCLNGRPHRNPDGVEISGSHIHYYREGYGDKWAEELPPVFDKPSNVWQTFLQFLDHCKVTKPPIIVPGLFS